MQKLRIFQVLVAEILNAIDQNAAFVVSETLIRVFQLCDYCFGNIALDDETTLL